MCTLSWRPHAAGYTLLFNRDERHTRKPGAPPALRRRGGVQYVAPTDGDFGGTWIGVNDRGISACILNRYEDAPPTLGPPPVSRGLLLAALLAHPSRAAIDASLRATELTSFEPFTMAVATPAEPVTLCDWNGHGLIRSEAVIPGLVRTSSGRDQASAERIRGEVWSAMRAAVTDLSDDLLLQFHRSHLPERGPFSVCMHREEAGTRSLTVVTVGPAVATLAYHPGPPCELAPPVTLSLDLART